MNFKSEAIIFVWILFSMRSTVAFEDFCFFPPEMEGEYITQNKLNGDKIQYSQINITTDTISPYGQCYHRSGNKFIVAISTEDDKIVCYRCFNLQLVSKNILLLIHTESDINSKCSSSAETIKCPTEISLNDEKKFSNDFHSIILYKVNEKEGPRNNAFCPFEFDGEIKFDYYVNGDTKIFCSGYHSTINNCPSSSQMNIRFKGCSKELWSVKYECIGHWRMFNQNFLAVMETANNASKYKCGTYEFENTNETEITLKISSDCSSLPSSVINNHLKNQQIFKIKKVLESWNEVSDSTKINFPDWLQGKWQYLTVERNKLTYKDPSSFKTYYMLLVNKYEHNQYIVYSHSQCGEETYKCLTITQLHDNVIETQISSESSKYLTNYEICNSTYFDNMEWITQGRIGLNVTKVNCPIYGKYFGRIPDDMELCSLITSDCASPDIMHYEIGSCNSNDIYERRTYKCLGHWSDKKTKNVYTYTQRLDVVNTFECFVGLMTHKETDRIIIRYAGEGGNCYKSLDPNSYGMEMNRTEQCPHKKLTEKNENTIVKYSSTKYDIFEESNEIEFVASSTQLPSKHKKRPDDKNEWKNESISPSTTLSASSSVIVTMIYLSRLILMIAH